MTRRLAVLGLAIFFPVAGTGCVACGAVAAFAMVGQAMSAGISGGSSGSERPRRLRMSPGHRSSPGPGAPVRHTVECEGLSEDEARAACERALSAHECTIDRTAEWGSGWLVAATRRDGTYILVTLERSGRNTVDATVEVPRSGSGSIARKVCGWILDEVAAAGSAAKHE